MRCAGHPSLGAKGKKGNSSYSLKLKLKQAWWANVCFLYILPRHSASQRSEGGRKEKREITYITYHTHLQTQPHTPLCAIDTNITAQTHGHTHRTLGTPKFSTPSETQLYSCSLSHTIPTHTHTHTLATFMHTIRHTTPHTPSRPCTIPFRK